MAQRDNFFNSLDRILKAVIGLGIILVSVALIVLVSGIAYNLTSSLEIQVAVIGCIVLVFGFLAYKIFADM